MPALLICLCKEDAGLVAAAKKYAASRTCYTYFGGRASGIRGLLATHSVSEIIITAHGSANEIGEAVPNFMDRSAKDFAGILNDTKFSGAVYFDVCDGYAFGVNVKNFLTESKATIFGIKGVTGLEIDLSKCLSC